MGVSCFYVLDPTRCLSFLEGLCREPQELTLLTPGSRLQVKWADLTLFDGWPFPYQRPWILCSLKTPPTDCGLPTDWFSDSFHQSSFEARYRWLDQNAKWGLYSYFTTFHTNYLMLQAQRPVSPSEAAEEYEYADTGTPLLKNLSLGHYGVEGLLPRELARRRGEFPLLLVLRERGSKANPHLESQEFVSRWSCAGGEFGLYKVADWTSYDKLWELCSEDESVVVSVYSVDLKQSELQSRTTRTSWTDPGCLRLASWSYQLVYGGGADEHHAVMRIVDSKTLEWVLEQTQALELELLSRF